MKSQNDQAFITFTGFDFNTFEWLHSKFEPYFNEYSPFIKNENHIVLIPCPGKGRKRMISSRDCLALNLAWTRTRGNMVNLEIIFGMTASSVARYLLFGRRILLLILRHEPDAAVRIPSDDQIAQYESAIQSRHPILSNVWCAMDGLKLLIECAGDSEVENDFYNGWQCDHFTTGVFVFTPEGTISICAFNLPGSVHDSKVASVGHVYQKLKKVYERTGSRCCVDSAFAMKDNEYLIKSGKKNIVDDPILRKIKNEATSLRQTSEWGMHGLQSSFPRLKDRFKMEMHGERKRIVQLVVYLFNLHSRRVGINQIRNVYMPYLERGVDELLKN